MLREEFHQLLSKGQGPFQITFSAKTTGVEIYARGAHLPMHDASGKTIAPKSRWTTRDRVNTTILCEVVKIPKGTHVMRAPRLENVTTAIAKWRAWLSDFNTIATKDQAHV